MLWGYTHETKVLPMPWMLINRCSNVQILQVLIATSEIMEWIETVLMELDNAGTYFDISRSKVPIDLDLFQMEIKRRKDWILYI